MKKIVTVLLMSALTIGCFSGCGKKITEQSTFGNTPVIDETTITTTTETTIETQYEYVEDLSKYVSALHNNFPNIGDHIATDNYTKIVNTLQNPDCNWQVYGSNQFIAYNFNTTGDTERPVVDRIEYGGYTVNMDNQDDPEVTDYSMTTGKKFTNGVIYIKCFNEEDAMSIYGQACVVIQNAYEGTADETVEDTGKCIILYTDEAKEHWTSAVEVTYPGDTEPCYIVRIAICRE